jgi:hypothetical protein
MGEGFSEDRSDIVIDGVTNLLTVLDQRCLSNTGPTWIYSAILAFEGAN